MTKKRRAAGPPVSVWSIAKHAVTLEPKGEKGKLGKALGRIQEKKGCFDGHSTSVYCWGGV